jgi:regulator of CtrA degradation
LETEGVRVAGASAGARGEGSPIDFTARKVTSPEIFRPIFDEGLDLLAEAAAYLEGEGREDSLSLPTAGKVAYLGLQMRLVASLTLIASWLMLHRAVQEGELTIPEVASDPQRPKVSELGPMAETRNMEALPPRMRSLAEKVGRFRARIEVIERGLYGQA